MDRRNKKCTAEEDLAALLRDDRPSQVTALESLLHRSTDVSRTRQWLIEAGYCDASHVYYYFGARVICAGIAFLLVVGFFGFDNPALLIGVAALGFIFPRLILKRIIRNRRKPKR
jgi:hypothetical protein